MAENNSQSLYDAVYYRSHCSDTTYQRDEDWLKFFDYIAERIIADIQPKTVLDAGCAFGMLVERLRARGIDAWGIDISDFAIANVSTEMREYCKLGSILDPLPEHYDLIVSIEVVEHMPESESKRAIENLCQYSNDILISTTPYNYKEPTHFNVQPPDYWARQFARQSFFRDLDFDGTFISPWAARYRKHVGPVPEVIQAYERTLWRMRNEISELRESVVEQHQQIQQHEARWAELETGDTWQAVKKFQSFRTRLIPPGSRRESVLKKIRGK